MKRPERVTQGISVHPRKQLGQAYGERAALWPNDPGEDDTVHTNPENLTFLDFSDFSLFPIGLSLFEPGGIIFENCGIWK